MDKEELIVSLLKDVRADQKVNTKDISEIKIEVALNRQDLEEHMAQTRAVKELTMAVRDEANNRFEKIENSLTVSYLLKLIVTVASGIGVISGAIYGVIKLIKSGL